VLAVVHCPLMDDLVAAHAEFQKLVKWVKPMRCGVTLWDHATDIHCLLLQYEVHIAAAAAFWNILGRAHAQGWRTPGPFFPSVFLK